MVQQMLHRCRALRPSRAEALFQTTRPLDPRRPLAPTAANDIRLSFRACERRDRLFRGAISHGVPVDRSKEASWLRVAPALVRYVKNFSRIRDMHRRLSLRTVESHRTFA